MSALRKSDQRLIEKAYDGSAETAFMFRLGKEIADIGRSRGGQVPASELLKRLTVPLDMHTLSPEEKERFSQFQQLLVVAVARFEGVMEPESQRPQ